MKRFRLTILIVLSVFACAQQSCKNKVPDRRIPLNVARLQVQSFGRLLDINENAEVQNAGRIRSFKYSAEFFTKKDVESVLSQSGCKGVRLYHALDSSGKTITLIVGVNGNGDDMLPDSTVNRAAAKVYDPNNYIITSDETQRCPSMCDNGLSDKSEKSTTGISTADSTAKSTGDSANRRSKRVPNNIPDSLKKP